MWLGPCVAEAYETEIFRRITDGSHTDKHSHALLRKHTYEASESSF